LNLPFFIARRYFKSKNKKNFISIIANISMVGVAIGTCALVIVLSVFNGLEDLIRSLYSSFDPEIKVSATLGKSFEVEEEWLENIQNVEGVGIITQVIEDNALVRYKDAQMVVKIKGVSDNFIDQNRLNNTIVRGDIKFKENDINYALIGRGVQYALSINPSNDFYALQVFYPKNIRPGVTDPSRMYNQKNVMPGGIFAIEKHYDESYIFVPLDFAANLMEYGNKRTSLEIKTKPGYKVEKVQQNLKAHLGGDFLVLNSDEQHAGLLKAIKIEKLFVYITFSFILAIASFNIFFSLTMLAIDKKKDIAVLYALGANEKTIQRIFVFEGAIIAFTGAIGGLAVGLLITWLQQTFGLISMGMQTSIINHYPVKMQLSDFIYTGITIVAITIMASYRPAMMASKTSPNEFL
jgi:lipoprotein-releasing system permease protein